MLSLSLALCTCLTVASVTVEDAEFLGFSSDERLAAWRVLMVEQTPTRRLRYPLVRVVDSESAALVGEFRSGAARDARSGRVVNPRHTESGRWDRAKGLSAWQRLASREAIGLSDAGDVSSAVRVALKRGYTVSRESGVRLAGAEGIGFALATDLINGDERGLGRFGHNAARAAQVHVYASPSGYHVAVQCTFELEDGGTRTEIVLRRLGAFPVRARADEGPVGADRVQVIFGHEPWGDGTGGGAKG